MSGQDRGATDDAESVATIQEAIQRGVNLVDTADFYRGGHNELLIAQAIRGRRDNVILSDKFGGLRSPDGSFVGIDGRPASVKNYLTYSLTRLGVDHIDIYRPARLDPHVPIEDTIGAISDLVKAGYVRHVGLSEVGPQTVRRAKSVHPICDLQIEYSIMTRGPEEHIFPVLGELGVGVTAYGVLMHGLLSGTAKPAGHRGPRSHLPRFNEENFERNQKLVATFGEIAKEKGVSNSQLAIAWVLAKGPGIVPVVGARNRTQLLEALGALDVALSADDNVRIEKAVPIDAVAGSRYAPQLMTTLDSERTA
jgi:aryl-alcohol dehydrogenase-like predicted oxidoreductase